MEKYFYFYNEINRKSYLYFKDVKLIFLYNIFLYISFKFFYFVLI